MHSSSGIDNLNSVARTQYTAKNDSFRNSFVDSIQSRFASKTLRTKLNVNKYRTQ